MSTPIRRPRARARRASILITLVGLLATLLAQPASALSVRRTWTAHLGSSGSNGTAILKGYMTGPGSLALELVGLQPSTTYPVIAFRGACTAPILVARIGKATTDVTGAASRTTAISIRTMNAIWTYGRTGTIAIKVGTGALARCGTLTYPVATRIAISDLKIDLPGVRPPSGYPFCNVAMYYPTLSQPREGGVSLLYAHARAGMFLPLLERSRVNDGASLLGTTILVWTSDDLVSTYQIVMVRRHVTTLSPAFSATTEQLWVQTSEGPRGTPGKLIVKAKRIGTEPADHSAAHPTPRPLVCR